MSEISLSLRAKRTDEQAISEFMHLALENPGLVSLAAGFVDSATLPANEVAEVVAQILGDPLKARAALQYGTTRGYLPLREKILSHLCSLDGLEPRDIHASVDDVVVTTGSQQLLYLIGETLLDPGDIVIAEAPSYFVYHGALKSFGAKVVTVPMDDQGMNTDALAELLARIERQGDLHRVKLIYTVDYYQNPTGLTLSAPRRQHLLDLARRYSKHHRIFVLEDAAYRELRFEGEDVRSIKSLDHTNEHVILAMTFSKPMTPGVKTGYGILPRDLANFVVRFKGNHDFGSANFCQHILDRLLDSGAYHRHVVVLQDAYRTKRDAMLEQLRREFAETSLRWTHPQGGLYVWLTCPASLATGQGSPLLAAALREGVLYIPGNLCHVPDDRGQVPNHEARLSFGVATPDQIREGIRRLARAVRSVQ